jgi:hypothetical protein
MGDCNKDVITCTHQAEDQLLLEGVEEQIYLVEAEVVVLPYLQQQVRLSHYFEQPGNLMIPDTARKRHPGEHWKKH